jgi:ribosome-binding factor A
LSRRTDQVSDQLRNALSQMILRDVHDPRVKLVTVTDVRVTPDLRRSIVKVSSLGTEDERLACIEGLHNARGFLRSQLAARLSLRATPELVFELDRGAEHSQNISDLLETLHGRDEST